MHNIHLSSTHHYPSGKNSGLLSGSCWRPRKKNYWSPVRPWVLNPGLSVHSTTKTLLSGQQFNPTRECVGFFALPPCLTQDSTQNEIAATPYHDVLAPVFYGCIGAEPPPSHIQSANMINKRMAQLKLNLFIVDINSSPFLAMLFLSSPLCCR